MCVHNKNCHLLFWVPLFSWQRWKRFFTLELREGLTVCKTKKSHNNSERGCCTESSGSAKIRQTLNKRWKYVKINRCRLNPTSKIINVIDAIGHLNFGIFFSSIIFSRIPLRFCMKKAYIRQTKGLFKGLFGRHEWEGLSVTCTEVSLSEQQTI